nr:hypothetical protein [Arenibacterium halophilum]
MAKTTPNPCIVRDAKSTNLGEGDSLAKNMQRATLHPLAQFRAFVALREKGQGDEEIAAAFFVTPQLVKQRLKLAALSPTLLELYAEDEMSLEQPMDFTVNPDHERQVQVWEAIRSSWNKEPYQIRRMLTETSVRASARRAVFVDVEVCEAAGGTMLHDLFQGDDGGWLKPKQSRPKVGNGSKSRSTCLLATARVLGRLNGNPAPMTDDEGAAHAKLFAKYRTLKEEYEGQDQFPEEIDARPS